MLGPYLGLPALGCLHGAGGGGTAALSEAPSDATFEGLRAMVVGADTPAGAAVARAIGHAGASVALATMRADEGVLVARRTQRELREAGAEATTYAMDVTLGQNVKVTTRQITKELGGLDLVVSAPSHFVATPVRSMSEQELAQITAINYYAHLYAGRSAADEFRSSGSGRVLIVTNDLGAAATPGTAAYVGACAAALSLVGSLASEFGGEGVTVSGLVLEGRPDEAGVESVAERAIALLAAEPAEVQGRAFHLDGTEVAAIGIDGVRA